MTPVPPLPPLLRPRPPLLRPPRERRGRVVPPAFVKLSAELSREKLLSLPFSRLTVSHSNCCCGVSVPRARFDGASRESSRFAVGSRD